MSLLRLDPPELVSQPAQPQYKEKILSRIESDNDTLQHEARPGAIAKQTKQSKEN